MPLGKELAKYKGTMTSIRVCESNGGDEIVEGTDLPDFFGPPLSRVWLLLMPFSAVVE